MYSTTVILLVLHSYIQTCTHKHAHTWRKKMVAKIYSEVDEWRVREGIG